MSDQTNNTIKLSSKFESPEKLIGYCELHCRTERALFNGAQINDMHQLAGNTVSEDKKIPLDEWYSMHFSMADLCKEARANLVPGTT